ncbi:hypothetical protein DYH09_24025 [bacterium CPR1]|nr:hypothetical protein [bacterium CPR1]
MRSLAGRGLSLLETVIASLLFATITVSLVSLWFSHYRLLAVSQSRMVATYVCKQLMEDQLSNATSAIVALPRGSQPPITMTHQVNGAARRVVYEWSVGVVDTPDMKDVIVTVFWKEGGIEHETHLETLLFTLY